MTDEDGPRVHTLRNAEVDFRRDVFDLIKQGEAVISREARERAARATTDQLSAVAQRDIRRAAELAERFEWRPQASVALFEVQTCTCGEVHQFFRGFGIRYLRRHDKIERIAATPCLDKAYPYEKRELLSASPACITCIDSVTAKVFAKPYEFHPERKTD